MKKYKLVALIGKAGAGKDTVLKKVVEAVPSSHRKVSFTTRPPRENETDGVDYYFINTDEFANMLMDGDMIEANSFNDWFYGTGYESLSYDKINIGIFNPSGIEMILEQPDVELYTYKIDAFAKERLLRQLNREQNPDVKEIIRRFNADEEDFDSLPFEYINLINNNSEDLTKIVSLIAGKISELEDKNS